MESDLLKQSGKIMTREQVMAALKAVNEVLKSKNRTATVLITGGAAIMFLFPEFPRGVKDLDAGFMSPELLSAVEQVTWEQDLQSGWFNDTSKDYYSPKTGQTVMGPEFSNLKVELPSKDYLLCLKIMSGRPEEKANDVSDVAFMVSHMPEIRSERDWQENYYKWFGKKDWKPYTAEAARQAIEAKQHKKESKMKSKLAGRPTALISIKFTSSDTRVMEALYRKLFSLEDVAPLLEGQTLTATLLKPSDDLADQIILAGEEYGLQPTIHTTKASGLGKKGKAPYKVKEFEGFEILVGRSAIENDTLSFEVANPNDFWLHVDGAPGSHIVIRNPSNLTELPPSVLIEAKRLAIDNSKAKGRNDAMVHWGFAKDLSKPPSSAPGEVYLANWKVAKVKKADLPPPPPAYVQQNVQKPEWVKAPNTPKTIGIVVFEEANVSGDLGFQRKVLTHEAPVRLANDLIDELKEKGLKFNNQQVFKWLMSHIEVREFYTDKTDGTMYCHAEIEKRFFEGLVKTLSAPAK